ncbi:response regulator [Pontibaca salina]|uniref:Response regulator n=1 Tax=Pontibaca salina TaxID=2795731 RepID=A0A934LXX0_9RHOB|nr:response regulator [Pontibaca salina]MBI6629112.1 response regulator [Pontibaca salina]
MTDIRPSPLILVVEDEQALQCDIVEELQETGYRTVSASDGQEALDLLAEVTPDLILCDITMPGLNGYGMLRALRKERPELAAIPFVFLSALSEPREVVEGKSLGADDYLVKPVDYDLMLATIAARLRQVGLIRSRHDAELTALRGALAGFNGAGAARVLDFIALGVVLLDEQGKIIHSNSAAHDLAAVSDFIQFSGNEIRASDSLADRALQRAIREARAAAMSGREKTAGVLLQSGQDAGAVSVLTCALPREDVYKEGQPEIVLFLSTPDGHKRVSESLLMELFELTPTEARVAGALANSSRSADLAAELGVSNTTIAFHMRNLFQKTGTNRRADLIALILAGPMMIKSD